MLRRHHDRYRMLDPDLAHTVDVRDDLGGDASQDIVRTPNEDGDTVRNAIDFNATLSGKPRIARHCRPHPRLEEKVASSDPAPTG